MRIEIIKTLMIDGDEPACKRLAAILGRISPHISLVGQAVSVQSALQLIEEKNPCLVFLSTQLSDGNCFDLLYAAQHLCFKTILLAPGEQWAVKAFTYPISGYLLLPLTIKPLAAAIDKVIAELQFADIRQNSLPQSSKPALPSTIYSIGITLNGVTTFVPISDIACIEADTTCTRFYLADGTDIGCNKSIGQFLYLESCSDLLQVHKSYMVNKKHVCKLLRHEQTLVLSTGKNVPLGRTFKGKFDENFG
jgi:two-component system LytT family response regulator